MEEKITRLANYSTCDVADALLEIGHPPHGGFLQDIIMYAPDIHTAKISKCIGPAFTIKLVPLSEPAPKLEKHFADAAPEGSIVVVSAPPNTPNAAWGGLMNTRVRMRGVKGVVVDGRIRDLDELREDGLPVFAKGQSVLSARKYTHPFALDVPITIINTGITINPGDFIIADLNGVVCIPKELIDRVLELCEKQVKMDDNVKKDLLNGVSIAEAFKRHRG